ncbi:hypothetical protein E4U21_005397 [Claviceps maximensis]|nr:hypothetical protein E4U21_005397 [Claviceps maximensis]
MKLLLAVLLALVAIVAAVSESATCGPKQYSSAAVDAAINAACPRVKKGTAVGNNMYPHQYKNFEKFGFKGLSGPFFEFPLMANGQVYDGGNPGPDRVILTKDCTKAGVITHQGASNNAFVECKMKTASPASIVMVDTRFVLAVYLAMMTIVFAV